MRGKKNREVNIFSASVVDLFASGLGVFLIVAIIALVNQKKNDSAENPDEFTLTAAEESSSSKSKSSENKLLLSVIDQLKKENQKLKQDKNNLQEKKNFQVNQNGGKILEISRINQKLNSKSQKLESKVVDLQKVNNELLAKVKQLTENTKKIKEAAGEFDFQLGSKIELSNVQFYAGTDKPIQPYAMLEIKKLAKNLNKNPKVKIEVSGHIFLTEKEIKTGEDLDKSNLSGRRAQLVCSELVNLGVRRSRLRCVGYGGRRYKYLTNDQYSEQAQLNRRVEIEVLEK